MLISRLNSIHQVNRIDIERKKEEEESCLLFIACTIELNDEKKKKNFADFRLELIKQIAQIK